LGRLKFLKKHY